MSVVGVSYASSRTPNERGQPSELHEAGDPLVSAFQYNVGMHARVLYDCDEAEWFAILHGTGALVTRKGVLAQPGRSPLEAVNYGVLPLQTPLDYFGGNLGGGGYCVATRSSDGADVRILEVLPHPAVLAWRDVTIEGEGDAHPTCTCLLGGSLVVSCYPEFLSNQNTGHVVIATRELRRQGSGWVLGASVEWAKVRCPRINQPFMYIHEVCAVATSTETYIGGSRRLQGSMAVYFSLASRMGDQGFQHRNGRPTTPAAPGIDTAVYKVDTRSGSITEIMGGGLMTTASLWQSLENVYMSYATQAHSMRTLHVMGLTDGTAHSVDASTPILGVATLPRCGVLVMQEEEKYDDEHEMHRRAVLRVIDSSPGEKSIVARTNWNLGGLDSGLINRNYNSFTRTAHRFVFMDSLVTIMENWYGTIVSTDVLMARMFRADARAHARGGAWWLKPMRDEHGGPLHLLI